MSLLYQHFNAQNTIALHSVSLLFFHNHKFSALAKNCCIRHSVILCQSVIADCSRKRERDHITIGTELIIYKCIDKIIMQLYGLLHTRLFILFVFLYSVFVSFNIRIDFPSSRRGSFQLSLLFGVHLKGGIM